MKRHSVIATLLLLGGCQADGPPLVASDVHVTEPVPGNGMSAGYLTLANHTYDLITITRVESPQFGSVQLHESTIRNGVARMTELPEVAVGAGKTVRFERGGKHLMLMQPDADADSGTVTLNFYSGRELVLTIETRPGR